MDKDGKSLKAFNYCVSFIDLLGLRKAARGQGLLPVIDSEEAQRSFERIFRDNILPIAQLQRDVEEMAKGLAPSPNSPLRQSLNEKERVRWDEMLNKSVKTQYWSDGFVRFACLGDSSVKCQTGGVFEIFCIAGYFCLRGLVLQTPVRGAIDIAWGVEIRPGELCGPVIARVYELESEVAQYPRIVVGQTVLPFLRAHSLNSGDDPLIRASRLWAQRCLDMLVQDDDGNWIVHYLGDTFQYSVTHSQHEFLYGKARDFVAKQVQEHKEKRNSKLAFRYAQLLAYLEAHPPRASSRPLSGMDI